MSIPSVMTSVYYVYMTGTNNDKTNYNKTLLVKSIKTENTYYNLTSFVSFTIGKCLNPSPLNNLNILGNEVD